jgi:hypothetical protein
LRQTFWSLEELPLCPSVKSSEPQIASPAIATICEPACLPLTDPHLVVRKKSPESHRKHTTSYYLKGKYYRSLNTPHPLSLTVIVLFPPSPLCNSSSRSFPMSLPMFLHLRPFQPTPPSRRSTSLQFRVLRILFQSTSCWKSSATGHPSENCSPVTFPATTPPSKFLGWHQLHDLHVFTRRKSSRPLVRRRRVHSISQT